jgi:hypothetical protein
MQYSAQVNNQQSVKLADQVEHLPFEVDENENNIEKEARSAGRAHESEHAFKEMAITR